MLFQKNHHNCFSSAHAVDVFRLLIVLALHLAFLFILESWLHTTRSFIQRALSCYQRITRITICLKHHFNLDLLFFSRTDLLKELVHLPITINNNRRAYILRTLLFMLVDEQSTMVSCMELKDMVT